MRVRSRHQKPEVEETIEPKELDYYTVLNTGSLAIACHGNTRSSLLSHIMVEFYENHELQTANTMTARIKHIETRHIIQY